MRTLYKLMTITLMLAMMSGATLAQSAQKKSGNIETQAANTAVQGSGTLGRLPKWTGFTNSASVIGDSNIAEDKNGKVGIGAAPTGSLLTVGGMVHSLNGGFKFPDGTVQTTASGGVTIPLSLVGFNNPSILTVVNSAGGGAAVVATGGSGSVVEGGIGVVAYGGGSDTIKGGDGAYAEGGGSFTGNGGAGMRATGGGAFSGIGGTGMQTVGGNGATAGGDGIVAFRGFGNTTATDGFAGRFVGNVIVHGNMNVEGTLSKGGGSFKIDHPLDPENKYLYHSFVESPDMMNVYNGNITTDEQGDAVVTMPDYFEALNNDFRYQLTVIGTFAQAMVAEKVKGNRFRIRTSAPHVEVSWQVTGVRQDAWAKKNRIKVEVEKTERERGFYLHPEAFNQPAERSIEWAHNPELMRQMEQARSARPETRKQ